MTIGALIHAARGVNLIGPNLQDTPSSREALT